MEYEKKYKEALERARKIHHETEFDYEKGMMEEIFPELKESEDEKIKRELRNDLLLYVPTPERYIAWLEKQGKHKPYGQRKECKDCQFNYAGECKGYCALKRNEHKPTDKVEPKFHEGDWICNDMCIVHIASIENGMYYFYEGDGLSIAFVDKHYHLWTITDAKDGDVLVSELTGAIFLFRGIKDNKIDFYCDYYTRAKWITDTFDINDSGEHYGSVEESQDIHPATKEQCDTLMKAMTDAGWEFNFKKKELKKIKQNSVWREKDDNKVTEIIGYLNELYDKYRLDLQELNDYETWFKSIKQRLGDEKKPTDDTKKLDANKVIEWVKNTFSTPDMLIDKFKKDFNL